MQSILDPNAFIEDQIGIQVETQQIRKILHTIPDPYKEIFMWRVFGELSFKEIGNLYSKTDNWNCSDCTAEFEYLKAGKQIDKEETSQRGNDANVITAVKKKIAKRIFKMVAAVCLVFIVLFSAIMLYTSISYSVKKDNISLSTRADDGYTYIILETEAGKSLSFDSKTEDILNDQNEVCGQRITLYNLQYHNNFSQNDNSISWGVPLRDKKQYIEVIVELENDTLQISNAE